MSRIPTPPTLPKPKRPLLADDLDSAEHQDLLDLLWDNLEPVVAAWQRLQPKWLESAAASARNRFKEETSEILRHMDLFLKEEGDPDGAVSAAKERFERALSAVVLPSPPNEARRPEVSAKHYQQPITVAKHDRRGRDREETVGYIDIGCKLSIPSNLEIEGSPYYFEAWSQRAPEHVAADLAKLALGPVSWTIERNKKQDIWFDVRATLPRTGVLLQELRVLQELADTGTMIALVCDEIPSQVADVLEHEGFYCLTRDDINMLLVNRDPVCP